MHGNRSTLAAEYGHRQTAAVTWRALVVLGLSLLATALTVRAEAGAPIRLAFIGETSSDAFRGASQGVSEANVQGRFLGLSFELVRVDNQQQALALDPVAIIAATSSVRSG